MVLKVLRPSKVPIKKKEIKEVSDGDSHVGVPLSLNAEDFGFYEVNT